MSCVIYLPFVEAFNSSIVLEDVLGHSRWAVDSTWIFSCEDLDSHLDQIDWLDLSKSASENILTKVVATIPDIPPMRKFLSLWDVEVGAITGFCTPVADWADIYFTIKFDYLT